MCESHTITYLSLSQERLSFEGQFIVLLENASADVVSQVPGLSLDELGYKGGCHLDSVFLGNVRRMEWAHSSAEAR
jgi:hypothetical protein